MKSNDPFGCLPCGTFEGPPSSGWMTGAGGCGCGGNCGCGGQCIWGGGCGKDGCSGDSGNYQGTAPVFSGYDGEVVARGPNQERGNASKLRGLNGGQSCGGKCKALRGNQARVSQGTGSTEREHSLDLRHWPGREFAGWGGQTYEWPQLGRSLTNLQRTRDLVFGSGGASPGPKTPGALLQSFCAACGCECAGSGQFNHECEQCGPSKQWTTTGAGLSRESIWREGGAAETRPWGGNDVGNVSPQLPRPISGELKSYLLARLGGLFPQIDPSLLLAAASGAWSRPPGWWAAWWLTPWCPEWLWLIALACAEGIELGESARLRAGAFGAAFSHCLAHCEIAASCPCGLLASHVVGLATEVQQAITTVFSGRAQESAMQRSDFLDNELGRRIGGKRFYNPKDCYADCKAAMGGAVRHLEGRRTARPFGPLHPTQPGPGPSFADIIGLLPPGWGP